MTFAEWMTTARTEAGMSRAELARRLEVNSTTIAVWESGDRLPNAKYLPRIVAALGRDGLAEVIGVAG